MYRKFDELNQFGFDRFEAITTATTSTAKGLQAIATETIDYSKNSFENGRVLVGKLFGVKKVDEAFQLQSEFVKAAYDDFHVQARKIGDLYSNLAKEALKPIIGASPTRPVAEPKAPIPARAPKAPVAGGVTES